MADQTPPAAGRAILLCDDLIFCSRITGTARGLGLVVAAASNVDGALALAEKQRPSCLILDLSNPSLQIVAFLERVGEVCQPVPYIVAYGSHVDTATLRAAREAGCDRVLPRSKFVEELPLSLANWLSENAKTP